MKIRKIETARFENKFGRFTEAFCDLVEEKIGKLDTAHSFLYLFNRFGAPNTTYKEPYRDVYCYVFAVDNFYIVIHATGGEHVYFSFDAPNEIWDNHAKNLKNQKEVIIERLNKEGISFVHKWADLYLEKPSNQVNRKNVSLIYKTLNADERKILYKSVEEDDGFDDITQKSLQIFHKLEKQTKRYLTRREKYFVYRFSQSYFNFQFKDYPKIKKIANFVIKELLKPISVDNRQLDIKQYIYGKNKKDTYGVIRKLLVFSIKEEE